MGGELTLVERAYEALQTMDAVIDALTVPWHQQMARVVREHYRAEIVGDLEAIMATLAPDPVYRFYGSRLFPAIEIDTTEQARAMYGSIIDMGYAPAGALDDQRWAFGDWGVVLQGVPTTVVPGLFLAENNPDIDPDKAYEITYQIIQTHDFDPAVGLMAGEIVYFGELIAINEVDPPLRGATMTPRRTDADDR